MKRFLIAIIALLTLSIASYAQSGGGPRMAAGPMGGVQRYLDMDPVKDAEKMTKKLSKKLELTEEQETSVEELLATQNTKLKEIVTEYEPTLTVMREEMMAARDDNMGDREAMRASMQEIRGKYEEDLTAMRTKIQEVNGETDEEMKVILEEDQYEAYATMKEERIEERRRPGGRGGRRPNG